MMSRETFKNRIFLNPIQYTWKRGWGKGDSSKILIFHCEQLELGSFWVSVIGDVRSSIYKFSFSGNDKHIEREKDNLPKGEEKSDKVLR